MKLFLFLLLSLLFLSSAHAINETVLTFIDAYNQPLTEADVELYLDNILLRAETTNTTGSITVLVPSGDYIFIIKGVGLRETSMFSVWEGKPATIKVSSGIGLIVLKRSLNVEEFLQKPVWYQLVVILGSVGVIILFGFAFRYGYAGMRKEHYSKLVSAVFFFAYLIILLSKITIQPKEIKMRKEDSEVEKENKKYEGIFSKERH